MKQAMGTHSLVKVQRESVVRTAKESKKGMVTHKLKSADREIS